MVATTLRFSEGLGWTEQRGFDAKAATSSWKLIGASYLDKGNNNIHVVQALALLSIFDFTGMYLPNDAASSNTKFVLTTASPCQLRKPAMAPHGLR